jgi:hypothetical protein
MKMAVLSMNVGADRGTAVPQTAISLNRAGRRSEIGSRIEKRIFIKFSGVTSADESRAIENRLGQTAVLEFPEVGRPSYVGQSSSGAYSHTKGT